MKIRWLADGQPLTLTELLGQGGEGTVYALADRPDLVAKVYHQLPTADREAKLRAMVLGCDEALQRIAAWPVATLHTSAQADAPVCGFLMPRLHGCQPIHHLYNPGQRKQLFPEADFAFLVRVAIQAARAVAAVHRAGHVIGDINQGQLMVAPHGRVTLIDCDSFQIHTSAGTYACDVGVGHFTPPELQAQGFRGLARTVNHDLFGLAVLLFHLLQMGRHPYAGVCMDTGELPLEQTIGEFRYAYALDAASRRIQPPPNSVHPLQLSSALDSLYTRAFTEPGVAGRPYAEAWLEVLDGLERELRFCERSPVHQYPGTLADCPWCQYADRNLHFFYAPTAPTAAVVAPARVAAPPAAVRGASVRSRQKKWLRRGVIVLALMAGGVLIKQLTGQAALDPEKVVSITASEYARWQKIGQHGEVLPADAGQWVVVKDVDNGLMWVTAMPELAFKWPLTWQEASAWNAEMNSMGGWAGYHDWRLPASAELARLHTSGLSHPSPVEAGAKPPDVHWNTKVFPWVYGNSYWTANRHGSEAEVVDFSGSTVQAYWNEAGGSVKDQAVPRHHVRLVRTIHSGEKPDGRNFLSLPDFNTMAAPAPSVDIAGPAVSAAALPPSQPDSAAGTASLAPLAGTAGMPAQPSSRQFNSGSF